MEVRGCAGFKMHVGCILRGPSRAIGRLIFGVQDCKQDLDDFVAVRFSSWLLRFSWYWPYVPIVCILVPFLVNQNL